MKRALLLAALVLIFSWSHVQGQDRQAIGLNDNLLDNQAEDVSAVGVGSFSNSPLALNTEKDERAEQQSFHPQRFWIGVGSMAGANAVGMYLLADLWYSDYEKQSWRWYDDNPNSTNNDGWLDDWHDWEQMDQLGHFFSGFHLARAAGSYGRWSGLSDGWSGIFGGVVSSVFLTQVEIFDGWSAQHGASRTDLLANYLGAGIGGLQTTHPHLEWFTLKYSYHRSQFYDDDVMLVGNMIDDYEGDTFWFTFRPNRFLLSRTADHWPDWLAVSLGIGGEGLAHSRSGMFGFEHRREVFLSFDLDWIEAVDLPEPWHSLASVVSTIRIPMPTLQVAPDLEWHWIYF